MTSLQHVSDPQAVKLLLNSRVCGVLGQFLVKEQTASGAAAALNMDLRVVHRDVQALLAAGLLYQTRAEPRAGRAIRHYWASAAAYFVPRALTPDADFSERFEKQFLSTNLRLAHALGRAFERAVAEQGQGREWGLRVFWDGQGVQMDESYADAELRGVLTGWQGPRVNAINGLSAGPLTQQEAEDVLVEMIGLLTRLSAMFDANKAAGQGEPFAVRAMLAPLSTDDLEALRPW